MFFTVPERRGHATQEGDTFHQGAVRTRQKSGQEALLSFLWKKWRVGYAGLGLASLNNFSKLRVHGLSPVVQYMPPGSLRQMDHGPECQSQIEKVVGGGGLWIGWFIYKRQAYKQVTYYL